MKKKIECCKWLWSNLVLLCAIALQNLNQQMKKKDGYAEYMQSQRLMFNIIVVKFLRLTLVFFCWCHKAVCTECIQWKCYELKTYRIQVYWGKNENQLAHHAVRFINEHPQKPMQNTFQIERFGNTEKNTRNSSTTMYIFIYTKQFQISSINSALAFSFVHPISFFFIFGFVDGGRWIGGRFCTKHTAYIAVKFEYNLIRKSMNNLPNG